MGEIYKNTTLVQSQSPVVIGILFAGEPQLRKLIIQLKDTNIDAEIYVYAYFQNSDAHERLYKLFNQESSKLRIKVDADMTIFSVSQFIQVVEYEKNVLNLCSIYRVKDHFTNSLINGIHFYTPKFLIDTESIDFDSSFVDQFSNKNIIYHDNAFINHGENYSSKQRNDFIIHRLRKAWMSVSLKRKFRYLKVAFDCCDSAFELARHLVDRRIYSLGEYKDMIYDHSISDFMYSNNFERIE